jgi:cytochrome c553
MGDAPASAAEARDARDELRDVFSRTADARRGATVYRACLRCHGADGNGTPGAQVPVIAQQHTRVLAKQLVDYRHAERWDLQMEAVATQHHLDDTRAIADVAAYVSGLPRTGPRGQGSGASLDAGRRLYAQQCLGCHGAEGEGNGVLLVPLLAGQHYNYLLRQFLDTVEGRRPNMPPPHPQLLSPLGKDQLDGLADHLSRLQPARHQAAP